jgi:1D-myo-inositol-tetrakisphosphate 5-kinase/inositol-polyphosphate multikinase
VYKILQKHRSFAPFIATFHGIVDGSNNMPMELQTTKRNLKKPVVNPLRKQKVFIILEDLTAPYQNPSVIDLKLGRILWEVTASTEKINRLKRKALDTTSHSHGVRVDGMSVYCVTSQETRVYKRDFTWKQSLEELLRCFLFNGRETRYDIVPQFLEKLHQLRKCLEKHRHSFNFLQSSLLLIYDSVSPPSPTHLSTSTPISAREHISASKDSSPLSITIPLSSPPISPSVKIIDFDHTHTIYTLFNGKRDEDVGDAGCIFGIETLINLFEKIQKSQYSSSQTFSDTPRETAGQNFHDFNIIPQNQTNNDSKISLSTVIHYGHNLSYSDNSKSHNCSGSDSYSDIGISTS